MNITRKHENTRLLLTLFSPNQIRDIVDFVNHYGTAAPSVVYTPGPQKFDLPHLFAFADSEYIPEEDIPRLLNGLSLIYTASIRQPWGNDQYESMFKDVFNLPTSVAAKIAANVETFDPIHGSADVDNWLERQYAHLSEGLRDVGNWMLKKIDPSLEIDQKQTNDADFLYEMMLLGDETVKIKTGLIAARAKVMIDTGSHQSVFTGDVATGSATQAEMDLVAAGMRRPVSQTILGSWYAVAQRNVNNIANNLPGKTAATGPLAQPAVVIQSVIDKYDPRTDSGRENIINYFLGGTALGNMLNQGQSLLFGGSTQTTNQGTSMTGKPSGDPLALTLIMKLAKLAAKKFAENKTESGMGDVYDSEFVNPLVPSIGDPILDSAMDRFVMTGDINPLAEAIITDAVSRGGNFNMGEVQEAMGDILASSGVDFEGDDLAMAGGLIANWRKGSALRAVKRGAKRVARKTTAAEKRAEREYWRKVKAEGRNMGKENADFYDRRTEQQDPNAIVHDTAQQYNPRIDEYYEEGYDPNSYPEDDSDQYDGVVGGW